MKVFLTGITGLLGTNLVVDLLEKGHKVKGLLRDPSKYKGPNHQNLELIQGNLSDEMSPQLSECEVVIHAAAETAQHLIHYADYQTVNCDATRQLLDAAVRGKVKRFIFVSTTNTLGYGSLNDLGNEQKKTRWPVSASFYAKSKLEAETLLLQYMNKIEIIIINPGFMIGAYDSKPSSGRIILMGLNKKVIFYPCGGRSFVHVSDVAQGIINSMGKGINGERYLLVNENLTYLQFFRKLNTLTSQNPVMIKIPKQVLLVIGYGGDLLRMLGIKTSISSVNMRILCIDNFYSNRKSIEELGMRYQPVETAILDAVRYFRGKETHAEQTDKPSGIKNG